MKNNTVVTACTGNYFWGVFILACSMRKNGMDEPLLVYGEGFSREQKEVLYKLGDVKMVDALPYDQNMACRKGEAMLLAETEYITWADCDGYFSGNCSQRLVSPDPDMFHARMRSYEDNKGAFTQFRHPANWKGDIPAEVLAQWKIDVGERDVPLNDRACSSCFASLHRKHRNFLVRWDEQMKRVLPHNNVGVTNSKLGAYIQLDESVMNSLLCFMEDAPRVTPNYMLDKCPEELYYHVIGPAKPWMRWVKTNWRFHSTVMDVMKWCIGEGNILKEEELPVALRPGLASEHEKQLAWNTFTYKLGRLRKKLGF